jgi:hypothetical protein
MKRDGSSGFLPHLHWCGLGCTLLLIVTILLGTSYAAAGTSLPTGASLPFVCFF